MSAFQPAWPTVHMGRAFSGPTMVRGHPRCSAGGCRASMSAARSSSTTTSSTTAAAVAAPGRVRIDGLAVDVSVPTPGRPWQGLLGRPAAVRATGRLDGCVGQADRIAGAGALVADLGTQGVGQADSPGAGWLPRQDAQAESAPGIEADLVECLPVGVGVARDVERAHADLEPPGPAHEEIGTRLHRVHADSDRPPTACRRRRCDPVCHPIARIPGRRAP